MLDSARYDNDSANAYGRPSTRAFLRLEDFDRAFENIKKLHVRVAMQRNRNSWRHRSANEADRFPHFFWWSEEFEERSVWSGQRLMSGTVWGSARLRINRHFRHSLSVTAWRSQPYWLELRIESRPAASRGKTLLSNRLGPYRSELLKRLLAQLFRQLCCGKFPTETSGLTHSPLDGVGDAKFCDNAEGLMQRELAPVL